MAKLTYVVGSETRSVEVGDSCSIGRIAGNTIVLDTEEGASRRHCQILKIASGYELADLGSTNGTRVNGAPVKRHKLKHGDRIQIGKTELRFEDPASAEEEISLEEPAGAAAAPAAPAKPAGGASDQCCLVFAGGPKDGQKIQLDKPRVTFGRNPKNAVQLDDPNVSGFHAEVSREGGAYVLRDLGSTNGTLVDGEPVTELALQHGARIRMGATRFVFVDPAVSDFEKAMAAVDDLGSEWGLLRAEMDMSRVQQARRSQVFTIAAVLVVVLGGAAVVVTKPEIFTGERKRLETIANNQVVDFSFEETGGASWAPRDGTPTKARLADPKNDGRPRQGSSFYAVSRDGGPGTCAAARSGKDNAANLFTVDPRQALEFGAYVRTAGGGKGAVRISWLDGAEATAHEVGRNSTPLVSSSEWQQVKGQAMPPERARFARLELIDAAGGTAYFDDVFLVAVPGTGGTFTVADGAVRIGGTADGQTTLMREDALLLGAGAVSGGAARAEAIDDPGRRGDRVGAATVRTSTKEGSGARVEGQVLDPASGELRDFQTTFAAAEGRYVDLTAKLPADAAWVASLPAEFVKAGLGVRIGDEAPRRIDEAKLLDKVTEVAFGGDHRFKVTAAAGTAFRLALYRVGDGWEVGFAPSGGDSLSLRIDTDSQALIAEVDKLRSEAALAVSRRQFGLAVKKLRDLASLYATGNSEGAMVEEQAKKLEDEGRARLNQLEVRAKGAVEFKDGSDLDAVGRESETLATEYEGHEVGKRAKEIGAEADKAVAGLKLTADERAAAPLLRKADDFARMKMPLLAKAFYTEIVQRYPGTEAEKKAREKLAGL